MNVWGKVPERAQMFLGFDWGQRRVGVASGNRITATASPLTTLTEQGPARWQRLQGLVREWCPDALVVGVPLHPDGAPHEHTEQARRFARQLHGRFGLPVVEVDERYSTTEAQAAGARDADAAAACIILEQYLRSLR
ncbi:MAG: Holliday junction resolvase RuvX [Tepidimonas sp.]|uniref:Holliday junction resolvase RuvX n=1 Tax=Tepidimonas sp. TaxID=2002775 RepID=UPI00298EDDBC|nr:Holliday junction resolvase RuvX [Tepidimonas sp.]MCS6811246.1 Holliday junction resolvase RuvX [Tepidimonas sp.]MDW8336558.1 Holliday junction resolvase RuvX [Tepidimonas sp.]